MEGEGDHIEYDPASVATVAVVFAAQGVHVMLQVTRHTSHVTRHTSHVTRHTSHVTRHLMRVDGSMMLALGCSEQLAVVAMRRAISLDKKRGKMSDKKQRGAAG